MTRLLPDGTAMPIFDAALEYGRRGVPLVIVAGRNYGCGSSRDWAAKGVALLGVRAVIAESFERIHRTNLIGMGILPLVFPDDTTAESAEDRRNRDVRSARLWRPNRRPRLDNLCHQPRRRIATDRLP